MDSEGNPGYLCLLARRRAPFAGSSATGGGVGASGPAIQPRSRGLSGAAGNRPAVEGGYINAAKYVRTQVHQDSQFPGLSRTCVRWLKSSHREAR
jgi:hypothetical protein